MSQDSSPTPGPTTGGWTSEFATPHDTTAQSDYNIYADMAAFDAQMAGLTSIMGSPPSLGPGHGSGGGGPSPSDGLPGSGGGFFQHQQPMLPQDLFSLPMTLDWEWAEMSGGAYPTVENGNFGSLPGTTDSMGGPPPITDRLNIHSAFTQSR